ncbi:hypothetical protein CF326_g8749 [Tilletia indica]|nr:hypothetical protein CF326_g8749 [Tilletia indica]
MTRYSFHPPSSALSQDSSGTIWMRHLSFDLPRVAAGACLHLIRNTVNSTGVSTAGNSCTKSGHPVIPTSTLPIHPSHSPFVG